MKPNRATIWKNFELFVAAFLLFSAPAVFLKSSPKTKKVSLTYPPPQREIASVKSNEATVAQKSCEIASRWRYRCDDNKKNCVKDRRETYLQCKSL